MAKAKTVRGAMGEDKRVFTEKRRHEYNLGVLEITYDILDTITSSCRVEWLQHKTSDDITTFYATVVIMYDRHTGTPPEVLKKLTKIAEIHGASIGTGEDGSIKIYPKHLR